MRYLYLLLTICLGLMLSTSLSFAQLVRLGDEIELPIAEGWEIMGDTTSYPFLLMSSSREAEMLVFKSTIEEEGSIDNQASLKASVDRVIDSVILTLPDSKLLTSSGYAEADNVRFVLEFTSQDMAEGAMVRHRMMGVLYRLPSGDQYLFTLWGRAAFGDYSQYEEGLIGMQADFRFVGEHGSEVFVAPRNRMLTFGVPILLIIGLFMLTRYKQMQKAKITARANATWKCSCGTENREREISCHVCGQSRQVSRVS
jgi:hypothetical protein